MPSTINLARYPALVKSQLLEKNLQPLIYQTHIILNKIYKHLTLYPQISVAFNPKSRKIFFGTKTTTENQNQ